MCHPLCGAILRTSAGRLRGIVTSSTGLTVIADNSVQRANGAGVIRVVRRCFSGFPERLADPAERVSDVRGGDV